MDFSPQCTAKYQLSASIYSQLIVYWHNFPIYSPIQCLPSNPTFNLAPHCITKYQLSVSIQSNLVFANTSFSVSHSNFVFDNRAVFPTWTWTANCYTKNLLSISSHNFQFSAPIQYLTSQACSPLNPVKSWCLGLGHSSSNLMQYDQQKYLGCVWRNRNMLLLMINCTSLRRCSHLCIDRYQHIRSSQSQFGYLFTGVIS
jgi:hypothetical protein